MSGEEPVRKVIVAGVDGSAGSMAALRWARDYAAATGALVRAVRAWHYPSTFGPAPVGLAPEPVTDEVEERMRGNLAADVALVYPTARSSPVEMRVTYGHPAEVLIQESKDADLLVVGRRGHSSVAALLLGSVSMHCASGASCPVVVVHEGESPGEDT
jgi:nucleotide-binding universal stress UspA family protein